MSIRHDIYAAIPASLRETDKVLTWFGRWAMVRWRFHRCGSAEGAYIVPRHWSEREPREDMMHVDLAMSCHRALQGVPRLQFEVLKVLYIPHRNRVPPHIQLNRMRIPPLLSQERHLAGLRMFDNRLRVELHSRPHRAGRELQMGAFRQPAASLEAEMCSV